MKRCALVLLAVSLRAESLHYVINWPSGLSLGEATLSSQKTNDPKLGEQWSFEMMIDAGVPGFTVRDEYHAKAAPGLCSIQLDKKFTHGRHQADEHITFDQSKNTISRNKTEVSVSSCARDALTYIQFARKELSEGRLPPQQPVVFGALYNVRLEYTGVQTIKVGDTRVDADRIVAGIKGPASDLNVELFFARDPGRTPVLARVPLALGIFSVELVR
jgi:hypothetical protein